MRSSRLLPIVVLVSLITTVIANPVLAASSRWQWENPTPTGSALNDVAYGNGRYVAVGQAGSTVVSTDGINWTGYSSGFAVTLAAVVFGQGQFIAVGESALDGVGVVLVSQDGINWTQPSLPTTKPLYGITYGGGRFLAVGGRGAILTSLDGQTWIQETSGVTYELVDVAYGDGRYMVAGAYGVLSSTDAVTWKQSAGSNGGTSIAYGNGLFVLGGVQYIDPPSGLTTVKPIQVYSEASGWVRADLSQWPVSDYVNQRWFSIIYAGGLFLAVGNRGTAFSRNGMNWSFSGLGAVGLNGRAYGSLEDLKGVTYGNGLYVAVGDSTLVTSSDAYNWTIRSFTTQEGFWHAPGQDLLAVTYGGGLFAAAGRSGTILTSPDGRVWTQPHVLTGQDLRAVTYGNGRFVAVGAGGVAAWSSDGADWTVNQVDTDQMFTGIAYGNGLFVGVGTNGMIYTSPDGASWTARTSGTTQQLTGVVFGNNLFVATGWEGLLTSPDAVNWTAVGDPFTGTGITYGGGRFVAVGVVTLGTTATTYGGGAPMAVRAARMLTSLDGVRWAPMTLTSVREPNAVAYGDGQFVAVGEALGVKGAVLTSPNGVAWRTRAETSRTLNAVGWGNGSFVAVGDGGAILKTEPAGDEYARIFPDLPSDHPARAAVEELVARGVLNGYPDGTFRPEQPVTRAEFAKMLVLATGLLPNPKAQLAFTDTAGHWASTDGYLQAAVAAGAINGFPDGTFQPGQPTTRAQVTKIAAAIRGLTPNGAPPYSDIAPTDWYAGWVSAALAVNLIGSQASIPVWTDGDFKGNIPATRGEAAMLLANIIKAEH